MTGPMNLISAPARELAPASRRSGAEAGRFSAEAAPQHAFEQVLDIARQHPQQPQRQTDSADSAAGAGAETPVPNEPTTPRRTGIPAFFAAALGPTVEVSGSTAQHGNTAAPVIDLDLVRGTVSLESAIPAMAGESSVSAETAAADTEVAETSGTETTDVRTSAIASGLVEDARTEAAAVEPSAGTDQLGTDQLGADAEHATWTRQPAMPAVEDPAAQSARDGQADGSGRPAGEEPVSGASQSVRPDARVGPDQVPAGSPARQGEGAGVSAEQLAARGTPPASSTHQATAPGAEQSAENFPEGRDTRVHQGADPSTSALEVSRQQAPEEAAVHASVRTGTGEGSAAGSTGAHAPTLPPSDVTMSNNQTPGTGVPAGVTGETPLAPASGTTNTPTSAPAPMPQAGAVQPTAAPAPAAAAQPSAPAAPPLQAQLAGPIAQLATGPAGEKMLTVNVAPENLGPVTVRASISGDAMRIELFAPQDVGREALRGMLTDLRRDLAGLGLGSSQVSLGEGDPPSSSSGQPRGDAPMGERSRDPAAGHQPTGDSEPGDQQRDPSAEQLLNQPPGAAAIPRLVGSALLSEAPQPVGLDLMA
ncbi:flagellar hook-length control protein FliK [Nesterenkonia sp. Act20]|uniref:flagellar hook-length control protein FliK n=1 Tax=Nesterenkonia sp. Act20 TaxID=1483432 RepID=UPI001C4750C1|nr:flagellar hook-length control protein FliK [Nesterenkonia sp. Act20]